MFTRRRLRSALSVLVGFAVTAACIGLGTSPAEADDIPNALYPVEDEYRGFINGNNPAVNPPFQNVVYDNGSTAPCDVEVAPTANFTVVHPAPPALGAFGDHPVVVWGNGTSGTIGIAPYITYFPDEFPDEILIEDSTCMYQESLKHLASMGFVVVAPNDGFVGSGTELQNAVDFAHLLDAFNDPSNPLYDNLDTGDIAAAGHSQGAIGAVNAAAADSRIDSVLAISAPDDAYCASEWEEAVNGLGWEFDCYDTGVFSQLDVPTFFVSGERDCFETTLLMRPAFREYLDEIADYWWDEGDFSLSLYYDGLSDWVANSSNTPCIASNAANQTHFNATSGPAAKATALPDSANEHAGHMDVSEGFGYMTAWLAFMSDNAGFAGAEDAFCGTSPEIAGNSGWSNWQAKSLPC